ncbi:hypothetical protein JOF56_010174 [Kibdelosporangium banguiense]|uniref:LmbU n=1 Tax=Kibdelosporangium banguiense TaxID=1365924 RepID=A0ABS4TZF2_9PSEU|nr:LmbU family transcriptional regulator [Kibdelosporangium banguiense]MBP2329789.1 hypothetical protein [Kibdelosporangium banguiense]
MDTQGKQPSGGEGVHQRALSRQLDNGAGWGRLPHTTSTRRTSFSLPPGVEIQEWSRIGHQINAVSVSSAWWLGDWLIYGQAQYPDLYKQAIEQTSLDYQTLRNYAWVARQYAVARRRPALSFQHHAELAALTPLEQDQWLDRAEKFGWSRNELRNRVRASRKAGRDAAAADRILKIQMTVPPSQKQRWMRAAASDTEKTFEDWMVGVLDNAAAEVLQTAGRQNVLDN